MIRKTFENTYVKIKFRRIKSNIEENVVFCKKQRNKHPRILRRRGRRDCGRIYWDEC
jgi:hypothetical protein